MSKSILHHSIALRRSKLLAIGLIALGLSSVADAGYRESRDAFSKHDYKAAYDQCIHAANAGNPDCQNAVGYLVKHGYGVPANFDQAFGWFQQAANKKNPNAQYNLALMFSSNDFPEYDLQKSAKWFLKAAEANHVGPRII